MNSLINGLAGRQSDESRQERKQCGLKTGSHDISPLILHRRRIPPADLFKTSVTTDYDETC